MMPKHISCTATSVQPGVKRFPDRHERPQVKAWRCDLTALSRSHNFYFVACNDTIHVYQPKFPDQSIPGEPELILHPPVSSPYLQPGIDYEDSHSITRLHVDYLGQDEIILITCDDGDVIGYRTEEIQRVLDKRTESSDDEQEFQLEDPVRTFLHRNVGASAWGLAIHREARMIAISANTHKVTVLAYALATATGSPNDFSDSDSELEDCPEEEDPTDFPAPRRQDHVITLSARHNVPAVSFNNTDDDASGRWLSSSSIDGEATIWDLHQSTRSARTIQLGFCASVKDPTKAPKLSTGSCACIRPSNFPHAVWSTMFLDANTAHEEPPPQPFTLPSLRSEPYFWDVSECKTRFVLKKRKASASDVMLDGESSEMDVSDTESSVSSDNESSPLPSNDEQSQQSDEEFNAEDEDIGAAGPSQVSSQSSEEPLAANSHVDEAAPQAPFLLHSAPQFGSPQTPSNAINIFGVWFHPPASANGFAPWDDDDESGTDDEDFIASTTQAHMAFANAARPARAYCEVTTAPSFQKQRQSTSPLLIVTKEDVYLCQRPLDYSGDHLDPTVTIRRPLHPADPNARWPLIPGSHDRHCYTTQIPELGVFIIASPNGRAGIFTLTKLRLEPHARPIHSFQLEYVLPFSNDDKDRICDVEGARLIGVAAGPVQGMLDRPGECGDGEEDAPGGERKPGSRRWRVMMYFTDHTVLAFELGKRRGEVPEVGELVV
ncbi:hypothetical protein EKO04_000437 [Ascochyta lentis]|uniref:Uncharacterized protein n=1 Tax=Ascochyta lentis TaxID=205686 RepID=A0A8H7MID0_9PLEO|nr:hypothetical protein EKO04_000437 [Ascochyta lentis]